MVWALGEFTCLLGVLVSTQDLKFASQISPKLRVPLRLKTTRWAG